MDNLKLFEVNDKYITYLGEFEKHLFKNKNITENNERKYIGILFEINGFNYFAPLSSFKKKHFHLTETIDFQKIQDKAVINLNCMFPAPLDELTYVNIKNVKDVKYRALLLIEYDYIKKHQKKLRKNSAELYKQKTTNPNTKLAKRCNDFKKLEDMCLKYKSHLSFF